MSEPILECSHVWRTFKLHNGSRLLRHRIKETLSAGNKKAFIALRDISFSLDEGESLAIVGRNGAGKSTLLSVICGLARPDRGTVRVRGRIAPLLQLAAGFHGDLTGRENLFLNAALMGFSEKETRANQEQIIDFAGISDFIDEPLRNYSSGMTMRLAFSIAINVEPDILIVDEILAVGDESFTKKCLARIHEIRNAGHTFICVSHSPETLQMLCDRALWLDSGELMMEGSIKGVLDAYHQFMTQVPAAEAVAPGR